MADENLNAVEEPQGEEEVVARVTHFSSVAKNKEQDERLDALEEGAGTFSESITIGETTLSEAQLIALLALLN